MVKLEDYTSSELKKMISSFNKIVKFAGYSKLKKADLIKMIRTHPKIKVEEGANAVKLSIKTDQDFEKQTKVKKEKVKKEVKKEVEKLDDVKVEVKPEKKKKIKFNVNKKAEPVAKAEEPVTNKKEKVDMKKLFKEAVNELSNAFESKVEDDEDTLQFSEYDFFIKNETPSLEVIDDSNLTKKQKETLYKRTYNEFKKMFKKFNEEKKSKAKKSVTNKKEKSAVDIIADIKEVMNPIFDKKFNPKSVVNRIDSMKDIDDINKEITIIQKKVKEVSGKSKSSGKETEAETTQLQKLQEKFTKRLKSIIKSMKTGASYL